MNITLSKQAAKALEGMDGATKARVVGGIRKIPDGDIKSLHGFSDGRKRLRIGKYRIIFISGADELHVLSIGSRGDIYK